MTNDEAKAILMRHRPLTRDADDSEVAEALRLAQSDPALAYWLAECQRSQDSIHRALASIQPPVGLREQILAERPQPARTGTVRWRRIMAGALVVVVVGIAGMWLHQSQRTAFDRFSTRMVKTALRTYVMDRETQDAGEAQTYLAQAGAPADYVLPQGLSQTTFIGCSALKFDGRPVTLLCFQSGRPLSPGAQSDLWLFVVATDAVSGGPQTDLPDIRRQGVAAVATWSESGKTYLLVTSGSEADLHEFL